MSTPAIKEIRAEGVPANPLYSQGVTVGNMVFLAGVTSVDPATGSIVTGTVGERTVRVNIFLTDMSDYNLMNEAYKQVFNQAVKPVRTCVAVKELPRATDVEIEVTATL
ncbi:hypothetical protein ACHAQJ_009445 [Trichoderma viride]